MNKKTEKSKLTLIIAEKPSVAADLVKALGAKNFKKEKTHFESDTTIVSWAIGHLVTIADPKNMDERYKSWDMSTLPIIPDQFVIMPIPETKSQLSALGKFIRNKDVSTIINACDAGREGELIFHYIIEHEKGKTGLKNKEIKRLWMQSMTTSAIKEAFENLRSSEEMQKLQDAAISRSEADWLIGINGSRGLTAYKSSFGGFQLTPCGRVQTPTLAMIVKREDERNEFVPQDYWTILGLFKNNNQEYEGKWFRTEGKENVQRIWEQGTAEAIVKKCEKKTGTVTETTKPSSQKSPPLYDLTSLQREANNRFGFSAKTTLQIAQALYERHKLTTYPRTDSKCLPEDYISTVKKVLESITGPLAVHAQNVLKNNWVKKDPKVFNNKNISDHHAIIPTGNVPKSLSEAEQKIFTLICQRFISVFFPPAKYLNTTRITVIEEETFITEGKVLEDPGFKAVYGKDADTEQTLPPLGKSNEAKNLEIKVNQEVTKPAARYTESSLLSLMESAGKLVEDDDLRDALKDRGLGTPATRAAIIEKLITDKYVVRDAKELVPTSKAFDLIRLLSAMNIEPLTSAELTGEWEHQLGLIEKGEESRESFMKGIIGLTQQIVSSIKSFKEEDTKKEASFSPVNGIRVYDSVSRYETEDGIMIRKMLGGRLINEEEVQTLLLKRKIGPLSGFRSKRGAPFSAVITINDKNKVEFFFDNADNDVEVGEQIGISPIDQSPVFDSLTAYISESALQKEKTGFRLSKMILGKEISVENIKKMLAGEKSDLIQGFRSAKTKRLFDAYLTLDKNGKIKFDFPPRVASAKKTFARKKTTKASESSDDN
jgi:DNA topoisomerase-3